MEVSEELARAAVATVVSVGQYNPKGGNGDDGGEDGTVPDSSEGKSSSPMESAKGDDNAKVFRCFRLSSSEREAAFRTIFRSASTDVGRELKGIEWARAVWGMALVDELPRYRLSMLCLNGYFETHFFKFEYLLKWTADFYTLPCLDVSSLMEHLVATTIDQLSLYFVILHNLPIQSFSKTLVYPAYGSPSKVLKSLCLIYSNIRF